MISGSFFLLLKFNLLEKNCRFERRSIVLAFDSRLTVESSKSVNFFSPHILHSHTQWRGKKITPASIQSANLRVCVPREINKLRKKSRSLAVYRYVYERQTLEVNRVCEGYLLLSVQRVKKKRTRPIKIQNRIPRLCTESYSVVVAAFRTCFWPFKRAKTEIVLKIYNGHFWKLKIFLMFNIFFISVLAFPAKIRTQYTLTNRQGKAKKRETRKIC